MPLATQTHAVNNMGSHNRQRVTKKCPKACERCRLMKVKCSGQQPCARCGNQSAECIYVPKIKRVLIPKSYLLRLENALETGNGSAGNLETTAQDAEEDQDQSDFDNIAVNQTEKQLHSLVEYSSPNTPAMLGEEPGRPESSGFAMEESASLSMVDTGNLDAINAVDATASYNVQDDHESPFSKNPPVESDPPFRSSSGRFWYLAPSSSWAFCRRVLGLLGRKMPPETDNALDPFHIDGEACNIDWQPLPISEAPDVSDLPPLDYSLFLYHAVKYYFGILNHLIDEEVYLSNLRELCSDPVAKAESDRMWYTQHLFILAFGKAFVSRKKNTRKRPAGIEYAIRALSLLPTHFEMGTNSLCAVKVLVLAAVYLQSVDMRVFAFQYIGHAARLCVAIGMHRHMPERLFGTDQSNRYKDVFWVTHIIDSEFSALMGATATVHNEQITAKLPNLSSNSLEATSMSLHVRLSRLMATILTTVYGVGNEFDGSLVRNIKSNLYTLAQISTELHALLDTHFEGNIPKTSRTALRLLLSYHHCVVLTTRPLVMCALHLHLESTSTDHAPRTINMHPPVSSILQSCVKSACTVLQTLCSLCEEDILESFMPFDLEDAFSSAFLLHILSDVSPVLVPDNDWKSDIKTILEHMVNNGSVVAPLRQRELRVLEKTLTSIAAQANCTPAGEDRASSNVAPTNGTRHAGNHNPASSSGAMTDQTSVAEGVPLDGSTKDSFLLNTSVAPPSDMLLDWAQQLDMPDFLVAMNENESWPIMM